MDKNERKLNKLTKVKGLVWLLLLTNSFTVGSTFLVYSIVSYFDDTSLGKLGFYKKSRHILLFLLQFGVFLFPNVIFGGLFKPNIGLSHKSN